MKEEEGIGGKEVKVRPRHALTQRIRDFVLPSFFRLLAFSSSSRPPGQRSTLHAVPPRNHPAAPSRRSLLYILPFAFAPTRDFTRITRR